MHFTFRQLATDIWKSFFAATTTTPERRVEKKAMSIADSVDCKSICVELDLSTQPNPLRIFLMSPTHTHTLTMFIPLIFRVLYYGCFVFWELIYIIFVPVAIVIAVAASFFFLIFANSCFEKWIKSNCQQFNICARVSNNQATEIFVLKTFAISFFFIQFCSYFFSSADLSGNQYYWMLFFRLQMRNYLWPFFDRCVRFFFLVHMTRVIVCLTHTFLGSFY